LTLASYGVFGCFFNHLSGTIQLVRNSEIDTLLTKPKPAIFLLIFRSFNPVFLTHVAIGASICIYASTATSFGLLEWITLLAGLFGGVLLQLGIVLSISSLSFFLGDVGFLYELFIYAPRSFSWFPLAAFPSAIRFVITYAVPYGIVAYFPLMSILDSRAIHWGCTSIIVGALFASIGLAFFSHTLRKYQQKGLGLQGEYK
jgi:ABC-2 type transport system permease protein